MRKRTVNFNHLSKDMDDKYIWDNSKAMATAIHYKKHENNGSHELTCHQFSFLMCLLSVNNFPMSLRFLIFSKTEIRGTVSQQLDGS